MGHKVNPRSLRLQLDKDWQSKWFATKDYASQLIEDIALRKAADNKLSRRASVSRIDIERSPSLITNNYLHG